MAQPARAPQRIPRGLTRARPEREAAWGPGEHWDASRWRGEAAMGLPGWARALEALRLRVAVAWGKRGASR